MHGPQYFRQIEKRHNMWMRVGCYAASTLFGVASLAFFYLGWRYEPHWAGYLFGTKWAIVSGAFAFLAKIWR